MTGPEVLLIGALVAGSSVAATKEQQENLNDAQMRQLRANDTNDKLATQVSKSQAARNHAVYSSASRARAAESGISQGNTLTAIETATFAQAVSNTSTLSTNLALRANARAAGVQREFGSPLLAGFSGGLQGIQIGANLFPQTA